MNLVSSNKVETNTVELVVKVEGAEFATAMSNAYKKSIKKMNVPGFRRGKAPRGIVEKLYGKNVFVEDAVNLSYPEAYQAAIDEAKLEPVDVASVDITEASEEGYTFKASVTVKPEVEVKDYKGIKAEKNCRTVGDEDIEGELNKLKERNARLVDVEDRAAQTGDTVIIDYSGSVDDVPFEGGTAENQTLALGSGQFIPGFEEQVVGHSIGDAFDVNVTFPEEYHAPELKGKAAVFKVKLNQIKAKEYPAIDDEFAKDVSEFDTLEELKKDFAAKLQEQFDTTADNEIESQLIDGVIAGMSAEVPSCMTEREIDAQMQNMEHRLSSQGMTLELYMQYTGSKMEDMRNSFKEGSEKRVKVRLALEKIAQLEKIEIAEEDLEKEYQKLADQYKMELDKIKQLLAADDLSRDLLMDKTLEFVKANAEITEKQGDKGEAKKKAAPKKAAAKTKKSEEEK